MNQIYMITQDNCPKCISIDMYLKHGLNNQFKETINIIKKEDNEELFNKFVEKYNINSTPTFVAGDETLFGANLVPNKVKDFITNHAK